MCSIVEIYFFWVDWCPCPHCKNVKPEWIAFTEEYDEESGNSKNGYTIKCVLVDCSDHTKAEVQMMGHHKVGSYPTVVGVNNSQSSELKGKITKDSLENFLEELTGGPL